MHAIWCVQECENDQCELKHRHIAEVAVLLAIQLVSQVWNEDIRNADELKFAILQVFQILPHKGRRWIVGKRDIPERPAAHRQVDVFVAFYKGINCAHDTFVLLMTARALIKVIHQHDATGFELLAGMHHVAQDIFVLMVGVDVDYIEVGVREALDALDGSCTNHTYARLVRETANDSLVVLLLMLIGIIAVVFPVHASGKGAEILGGVPKGIVLVGIKLPIVDEVVPGWTACIEHDLREIAFVNSNFGPDRVLRDRLDQAVPIAQHEVHNSVPLVGVGANLAKDV